MNLNKFTQKVIILMVVLILAFVPTGASAQDTTPPQPANWPKPLNFFGLLVPTSLENASEEDHLPFGPEMGEDPTPLSTDSLGEIVYQTYVYGNWDILHTDGSHSFSNLLTTYTSSDVTPRLNLGATKVVFASNIYTDFEILSKDIATGTLANLTNNTGNDYTPEWSPDGTKIVFVGMSSSTNPDIYVVNANGTNITRLTNSLTEMDYFPTWSPDGSKIMWVKADEYGLGAIWMMNADGSNKIAFSNQIWYMQHPIWSKDGLKIAFDADLDGDGWNELASVNSDGSNFQVVLDLNTNLVEPWAGSWSPNGGTIYFTKVSYSQNSVGELSIYLVNVGLTTGYNRYSSFTSTGYDMNPDYKPIELLPPISAITPLPTQSPFTEFSISCQGTDQGPSGIGSYEFQYRVLPSTSWILLPRTMSSSIKFYPTLATSACFHCRAIDNVLNYEAWPPDGTEEACTSFFSWDLTGKITDSRGVPLANASLDINPDPGGAFLTGDNGIFTSRLVTEGTQTISVNSGLPEPYSVVIDDVDSPMALNLYAIPSDSIIQNGSFESGMVGWDQSGDLERRVTNEVKVSGLSGVEIGSSCTGSSCIDLPEELGKGEHPSIVVDSQGQLHMVYYQNINDVFGIYYRYRNTIGVWSNPIRLDYITSAFTDLVIDDQQTLHAVWAITSTDSISSLKYSYKRPGEAWSQLESLYVLGVPHLEVDNLGRAHVFGWTNRDYFRYYVRSPQGGWSNPAILSTTPVAAYDVTKSDDDAIHVAYADLNLDTVTHLSVRPTGSISLQDVIYAQTVAENTNLSITRAIDNSIFYSIQDGNFSTGGGTSFGIRNQYGIAINLGSQPYDWAMIDSDSLGSLNQFASQGGSGYYQFRSVEGAWETAEQFFQDPAFESISGDIFTDNYDIPYILLHKVSSFVHSLAFYQLKNSGVTESGTLSQEVVIPSLMKNPTLAFMYRSCRMTPESQSGFHVQVEEEGNVTTVLDVGYSNDWKLAWVDLSPWTGKTITVKLTLDQQPDDPFVKFYLDDISLGSWTTPWIESVEPTELITYGQDLVTIHGGNFYEPLNLFLNQIPVTNFTVINDQTIQFNLPGGIGPGIYDVIITKSVGQKAMLRPGLRLGLPIFAPAIMR